MGAVEHMALEVTDMKAMRDLVQERGKDTDLWVRAHVGNPRHWLMHLFDPDGSRAEDHGNSGAARLDSVAVGDVTG